MPICSVVFIFRGTWNAQGTWRSFTKTEMGTNSFCYFLLSCCIWYKRWCLKKKYVYVFIIVLLIRLRKEEISALSGPNEFAEFYSRLRTVKEFHRKHPNEVSYSVSSCQSHAFKTKLSLLIFSFSNKHSFFVLKVFGYYFCSLYIAYSDITWSDIGGERARERVASGHQKEGRTWKKGAAEHSFCCVNEVLRATRKRDGLTSRSSHVYLYFLLLRVRWWTLSGRGGALVVH